MDDEELELINACTDLVSLKRCEAFPGHLLRQEPAGAWVGVQELCQRLGLHVENLNANLFVTWLADPAANDDYAVVMFYDGESKWTMAAHYNRRRLAGEPLSVTDGSVVGQVRQRNEA
jgi:hypothetical protein